MTNFEKLVVFALADQLYALRISCVERIVRSVEVTPLPTAPEVVFGIIDYRGSILPVLDVRRRFRLPASEVDTNNHFIISHTPRRRVALIVDSVKYVIDHSTDLVAANEVLPSLDYVEGVIPLNDGLILIHDLARFLSMEEEEQIDKALINA